MKGRCIYEREDVFMKGRCIHEGDFGGPMFICRKKRKGHEEMGSRQKERKGSG